VETALAPLQVQRLLLQEMLKLLSLYSEFKYSCCKNLRHVFLCLSNQNVAIMKNTELLRSLQRSSTTVVKESENVVIPFTEKCYAFFTDRLEKNKLLLCLQSSRVTTVNNSEINFVPKFKQN
jgi:hypothetical protein